MRECSLIREYIIIACKMLKAQLYYRLHRDENISQQCCGDSIQIRYMVLYTTLNRLIVISEDKFTRELLSSTLSWPEDDQIIALKYKSEQFKLHILTLKSNYCVLTLGLVFQSSFQEEWNQLQYGIARKNDFLLVELTPTIVVNKENYSNVVTLGENNDGYRDIKQIMSGAWDFQFWDISSTDFYTVFMTQCGSALFFDFQKRNIPYIAEFRISILNFCVVHKPTEDYLLASTELNDIIRLQLSFKAPKKVLITSKYEDERFQGQLHRFSNQKF